MFEAVSIKSFVTCPFLHTHVHTIPVIVFDDCSLEREQEGRGEVQLIQCRVTCVYSIVLSVNQCLSSAKFAVKWEETNLPPVTAHSLTASLSVVN